MIENNQNEIENLQLVCAFKDTYDTAQKYSTYKYILIIIFIILSFFSNISENATSYIVFIYMIFYVLYIIVKCYIKKLIEDGAIYQELFDRNVFGLSDDFFKYNNISKIEYSRKAEKQFVNNWELNKFRIQAVGDKSGALNWYDPLTDNQLTVKSCHMQSVDWDEQVTYKTLFSKLMLVILITIALVLVFLNKTLSDIVIVIFIFFPLITELIESCYITIRIFYLNKQILSTFEECYDENRVQMMLYQKRRLGLNTIAPLWKRERDKHYNEEKNEKIKLRK